MSRASLRSADGPLPLAAPPGAGYLPRAAARRGGARALLTVALVAATGCATLPPTGPPLADPPAVARRAVSGAAPAPAALFFEWAYSGRRGQVEGEGVARYNPPDSLRIDLFTSGDVALAVSLSGDSLATRGEIEEVDLPSSSFLYAMAGLFHPASPAPARGYLSDGREVLVYGGAGGDSLHYFLRGDRLVRVEERGGGRVRRHLQLEWVSDSDWPGRAEYRDLTGRSRVRWSLEEARDASPHPPEIYDLSGR